MAFITLNRFDEYVAQHIVGQATGDLSGTTPRIALTSGVTFDPDIGQYWSDFSANEVAGTGYTAGGQALVGPTATRDDTNDRASVDWTTDPSWPNSTLTNVDGYVIYYWTGTASTSRVLGGQNFAAQSTNGTEFKVTLPTGGILLVG